jgi:nucleoside-diphosphate-sugar epimerase
MTAYVLDDGIQQRDRRRSARPRWCQRFFAAAKGGCRTTSRNSYSTNWIERTGVAWPLRPNSFFQNMLWSTATIKSQGVFYLPLRDARQSLVDVRDIASVAVAVQTGSGHEGKTYEITGPQSLSISDVAATFTKVLGRPIKYVDVPPDVAKDAMLKTGMPAWNAAALTEAYGVFATGQYARTTDTIEKVTAKKPIMFEQFVRDFAEAFS